MSEYLDDGALFDYAEPKRPGLVGDFMEPPFSVIDRRSGRWADRKRQWEALGIQSEVGREGNLTYQFNRSKVLSELAPVHSPSGEAGTSVFDPALVELMVNWYTRPGDTIIDPFAGGSVRGVVSSCMGRWYYGVDLSEQQIEANRAQLNLCSPDVPPIWINGDSTNIDELLDPAVEADFVMTCPPYGDLERYSDDPHDISTMDWEDFCAAYLEIIRHTAARLRRDRFAAVVISDIRDKRGCYRGLPAVVADSFRAAGMPVIGEFVLLEPIGTKRMIAERPWRAARTSQRIHQEMIVAVKGDRKAAAKRLEGMDHDPLDEAA